MSSALPWLDPSGNVMCRYCQWCVERKDGGDCTHLEVGFSDMTLDIAECELGEADPEKIKGLQEEYDTRMA